MIAIPHKTLERQLFKSGYRRVVGVDEVGMGCLAGPVVVCAAAFTEEFYQRSHRQLHGLRDSKLLNAAQREAYAEILMQSPGVRFAISQCSPSVIDKLNIYQASRLAMRRALAKLGLPSETMVLVDGNKKVPGLTLSQEAIIKGDRKVFAIACASVVAKVFRDKLMDRAAKKYPQYGFEKHKGYGTKQHQVALRNFGPSALHRRSFSLE